VQDSEVLSFKIAEVRLYPDLILQKKVALQFFHHRGKGFYVALQDNESHT